SYHTDIVRRCSLASMVFLGIIVGIGARRSPRYQERLPMPITDTFARSVKADLKPRKYSDSGGLYLYVPTNGSRLWRLAYGFAGKQKTLALGIYPAVGLADARRKRDAAKEQLA